MIVHSHLLALKHYWYNITSQFLSQPSFTQRKRIHLTIGLIADVTGILVC